MTGMVEIIIPLGLLFIIVAIKGCTPIIVKELSNGNFIIIVFQEIDLESIVILVNRKVLSLTIAGLKELGYRNIILVDEFIYGLIIKNEVCDDHFKELSDRNVAVLLEIFGGSHVILAQKLGDSDVQELRHGDIIGFQEAGGCGAEELGDRNVVLHELSR